MKKQEIIAYFKRSQKTLQSADWLFRGKFYEDSMSRSYYAILYAASSALLIHDIKTKSHTAVNSLFGEKLVKNGEIEKEWAKILSKEQASRVEVDYMPDPNVNIEEAKEMLQKANQFVNRIQEYLISKGIELPQSDDES